MTAKYRDLLAPLGITYPQYLVLLALWEAGGPLPMKELGARLELDSGTLSPLLRRLETLGFITRARDDLDERAVHISLTPTGAALRAQAESFPAAICASSGLSPEQLQDLQRRVSELAGHVRAATAGPATGSSRSR